MIDDWVMKKERGTADKGSGKSEGEDEVDGKGEG
jgi:hypothetical protein